MTKRQIKSILPVVLVMMFTYAYSQIVINEMVLANVERKFGSAARQRVQNWQQLLLTKKYESEEEKLFEVNRFFNIFEFKEDIEHWKQDDYWATPIEFLATNAGDCEDYTIAKYFSLLELGVTKEKLRLIYVTALRPRQAHMVLGYYATPNSVPLILDNINKRIVPANQRKDLIPIYSFNGDGLWLAKSQGKGRKVQLGGNNNLFNDLNERIKKGN